MREQIKVVMAGVFGVSPESLADDAGPDTVPEWDSLRQLELMLAIESQFGVRIPTESMLALQSLPQIEAFLVEHGAK